MNIEGMGRRVSKRDVQDQVREGEQEYLRQSHERRASEFLELARPIDERDKALTGRRIDDYVRESGLSADELFPENGRILNIGDPWQTLDREGVINLEYETGEEASFISDENYFLSTLGYSFDEIGNEIFHIKEQQPKLADVLEKKLIHLQELVNEEINVNNFPAISGLAQDIVQEIGGLVPKYYARFPDAWYSAVHIARGFSDLHLLKTVIEPAIVREAVQKKGLTTQQEAELKRQLIEEHRGRSKYTSSELVKGAFPNTDFEDGSFDRITASWSISAHMFAVMDARHFDTTFKEIDRLLRKDGAAYFWPMNYWYDHPDELLESAEKYAQSGGAVGFFLKDNDSSEIVWYGNRDAGRVEGAWNNVQTFIVLGRGYGASTKKRIEKNVVANDPDTVELVDDVAA